MSKPATASAVLALACALAVSARPAAQAVATPVIDDAASRRLLDRYCIGCHNDRARTGDLSLESLDLAHVGSDRE